MGNFKVRHWLFKYPFSSCILSKNLVAILKWKHYDKHYEFYRYLDSSYDYVSYKGGKLVSNSYGFYLKFKFYLDFFS